MMPGPRGLYSRKFGQVLLKNRKVAGFEASSLNLPEGSSVLEIGPGPGTITEYLLEAGFIVTAVEADHRFAEDLAYKYSSYVDKGKLIIVKEDFLKFGPATFDGVVGNVPYQISSEIIFHLSLFSFSRAVLMFQREFCQRLVAKSNSKEYSRLSVNAQLRYRIRIIANVSRNSFHPVPDVDSSVVELIPRNEFGEEQIIAADDIFKRLFSSRRKKISAVLKGIDPEYGKKRVGELSPEELLGMATGYLTGLASP